MQWTFQASLGLHLLHGWSGGGTRGLHVLSQRSLKLHEPLHTPSNLCLVACFSGPIVGTAHFCRLSSWPLVSPSRWWLSGKEVSPLK